MTAFAHIPSAIVRELVFPLWRAKDHPTARQYLREFRKTQFLSREQIEVLQVERLKKLCAYAYGHCSFYKSRFDEAGLNPQAIRQLSDLQKLPILTKTDIQRNAGGLKASGFPDKETIRNQTGGSTGSPLQFFVDKERLDSRLASTLRHNEWSGYRPGDWCALLWGARVDLASTDSWWARIRRDLLMRQIELNTSSVSEQDWQNFVREVRTLRPKVMLAYAQSAGLFAKYVREHGVDCRFESIIATAEVVLPETKALLESTFGARVYNRYGCREVSLIASECELRTGLHVNSEVLIVEIVADAFLPSGTGKILVTDLLNYSMPLIRYEIGDVGEWLDETCPCGRGLPMLKNIQGRTTDFLYVGGRHISGPSLTLVVADMPDVAQVQFVQKMPDVVTLRVVPGTQYGDTTRAELQKRLGFYLRGDAKMIIEEVTHIPSEISGKYRFVINEMSATGKKDRAPH